MALLGNGSPLHTAPGVYVGGPGVSAAQRQNGNKSGSMKNWGLNEALDWSLAAVPHGYYAGSAQLLPRVAGAMAARNTIRLDTLQTAAIVGEMPTDMDATLTLTQNLDAYRVALAAASITTTLSQNISIIGLAYAEASAELAFDITALVSASISAQMDAYLTLTETLDGQLAAAMDSSASLALSAEAAAFGAAYAEAQFLLTTSENVVALATKLMQASLQLQTSESFDLAATTATAVLAQLSLVANASAYGIGYMQSSTESGGAGEPPTAAVIAAEVWSYVARTLTAGGGGGGGLTVEQATWLQELYQKEGLDTDYPVTVNKALNKIFIGDPLAPLFSIDMSGDFRVITTLERAP